MLRLRSPGILARRMAFWWFELNGRGRFDILASALSHFLCLPAVAARCRRRARRAAFPVSVPCLRRVSGSGLVLASSGIWNCASPRNQLQLLLCAVSLTVLQVEKYFAAQHRKAQAHLISEGLAANSRGAQQIECILGKTLEGPHL